MSTALLFKGVVHKGRFLPDDWPRYARALERHEGKRVEVTFGTERKRRSDSLHDYYRGVVIRTIAHETAGDTYDREVEEAIHDELLHEVLVRMLPERFLRITKKGLRLRGKPSTKNLSHEEMLAYVNRCKDYAYAQWTVTIPDRDHVVVRRA